MEASREKKKAFLASLGKKPLAPSMEEFRKAQSINPSASYRTQVKQVVSSVAKRLKQLPSNVQAAALNNIDNTIKDLGITSADVSSHLDKRFGVKKGGSFRENVAPKAKKAVEFSRLVVGMKGANKILDTHSNFDLDQAITNIAYKMHKSVDVASRRAGKQTEDYIRSKTAGPLAKRNRARLASFGKLADDIENWLIFETQIGPVAARPYDTQINLHETGMGTRLRSIYQNY